MQEENFEIAVQTGDINYVYMVYPHWDEDRQDSTFTVGLDGVDIGQIALNENDCWEWIIDGLDQVHADKIGCSIENHYK